MIDVNNISEYDTKDINGLIYFDIVLDKNQIENMFHALNFL